MKIVNVNANRRQVEYHKISNSYAHSHATIGTFHTYISCKRWYTCIDRADRKLTILCVIVLVMANYPIKYKYNLQPGCVA